MWQPVIKQLPEYHCLATDQPEHGGSRQIGPCIMELSAEKVSDLIRDPARGGINGSRGGLSPQRAGASAWFQSQPGECAGEAQGWHGAPVVAPDWKPVK
jgi:hypothetical protein